MRRSVPLTVLCVLVLGPAYCRHLPKGCGTRPGRLEEDLQLHRIAARRLTTLRAGAARPLAAARPDQGDVAILDDADGVVARQNDFSLDRLTLSFTPSDSGATKYRYAVTDASYDAAAASAGQVLSGLGDDDAALVTLPFSFPFYGKQYSQVFVNSDGNLTFGVPEFASVERSFGRMMAGPPRIAPLFDDLDPTRSQSGVTVLAEPGRLVVSWIAVPEYQDPPATGSPETFQVRLYPDGHIQFAWSGIALGSGALVGIAPGNARTSSPLVDFRNDPSQESSTILAERFGSTVELDVLTATRKFFESHEDAYDYLVIFNNEGIADSAESYASERTVRNRVTGTGDFVVDNGALFGAPARLRAVINMGPLDQYPDDFNMTMPGRRIDTPIKILAHEAGHLFLAYASIHDPGAGGPADPAFYPMLGGQLAHWSFNFNSDGSLLEGNRIQDDGSGARPRFRTTGASLGYSALDQYLMGLRAPEDVPLLQELFYVSGSLYANSTMPRVGATFNGTRRDVSFDTLVQQVGRRTPDYTVAQRRYRFGFVLVVPNGSTLQAADLAKVNKFRDLFIEYFPQAAACTGCRIPVEAPVAETTLKRALLLSLAPGAGVIRGAAAPALISIAQPAQASLTVTLASLNGLTAVPASVTIPAGATQAQFNISGVRAGVDQVTATPSDPAYATAYAHVQVAGSSSGLRLLLASGDAQVATPGVPLPNPVVFQVVDANGLPYAGIKVVANVAGGGTVDHAFAVTDETGSATFLWTPGSGPENQLTAVIDGLPSTALKASALGRPAVFGGGVVSSASYAHEIAPNSLASIFGTNLWTGADADAPGLPWPTSLGGVRVLLNGTAVPIIAVREGQINFLVPEGAPAGPASLVVSSAVGDSTPALFPIAEEAPGIFFYPLNNNLGAIQVAGFAELTDVRPAHAGDYIAIYATGLGKVHASTQAGLTETDLPVTVFIGGQQSPDVPFSGQNTLIGVYQVNAKVPSGTAPGTVPVYLEIAGKRSNGVNIHVR